MKEKTVREWLNELPEPIRTRALRNEDGDFTDKIVPTLQDAIKLSFLWQDTDEYTGYWVLVSDGRYSEACALLGEKLQTEQTKYTDVDNSILEGCMENVAQQEYGKFWFELDDSQKAHLVKPVAIRYAELVNNQKQ